MVLVSADWSSRETRPARHLLTPEGRGLEGGGPHWGPGRELRRHGVRETVSVPNLGSDVRVDPCDARRRSRPGDPSTTHFPFAVPGTTTERSVAGRGLVTSVPLGQSSCRWEFRVSVLSFLGCVLFGIWCSSSPGVASPLVRFSCLRGSVTERGVVL